MGVVVAVLLVGCSAVPEWLLWDEMTEAERGAFCESIVQQYDGIDRRWGNAFQMDRRLTARLQRCELGGYLS